MKQQSGLSDAFIKATKSFLNSKDFSKGLEILAITNNKNRMEIIELLGKKGAMSIIEISNKVGLAYKNTHAHIKKLEDVGLVVTEKQEKVQGRKVIVDLSPIVKKELK